MNEDVREEDGGVGDELYDLFVAGQYPLDYVPGVHGGHQEAEPLLTRGGWRGKASIIICRGGKWWARSDSD